jgi:hypothetical protein
MGRRGAFHDFAERPVKRRAEISLISDILHKSGSVVVDYFDGAGSAAAVPWREEVLRARRGVPESRIGALDHLVFLASDLEGGPALDAFRRQPP